MKKTKMVIKNKYYRVTPAGEKVLCPNDPGARMAFSKPPSPSTFSATPVTRSSLRNVRVYEAEQCRGCHVLPT